MTNGEWIVANHYKFVNICVESDDFCQVKYGRYGTYTKYAVRNERVAIQLWLDDEHVEEILSPNEKEYLAGVIKPFKNRINFIKKQGYYSDFKYAREQIAFSILSENGNYSSWYNLPFFKKNEMYCGMKLGKEYTLEELGL